MVVGNINTILRLLIDFENIVIKRRINSPEQLHLLSKYIFLRSEKKKKSNILKSRNIPEQLYCTRLYKHVCVGKEKLLMKRHQLLLCQQITNTDN